MASRPLRRSGNPLGLSPDEIEAVNRQLERMRAEELEADARYLEDDLAEFVRAAWHIVEPVKDFVPGWHIDAICDHLEAVARNEIPILLISMPPGHMKTLITSVMFPAWLWCKRPGLRLLTACYSKDFAERDALSSRMIIDSAWYQARWPLRLRRDTNRKDRYENSARGYRVTTTVKGRATGEGGSILVGDDLISMTDIRSPARRAEAIHFLADVAPTRLRDEQPGALVLVGQRGHEQDPIGYMLERKIPGTVHLNLPARYNPETTKPTKWFTDPRTKAGQVLWPKLYPERRIRQLERQLTPDGAAAQLQQTPTVGGGSILPRKHWRIWSEPQLPACAYYMLSVDPAMKSGPDNSMWACQVWGIFEHLEPLDQRSKVAMSGKRTTHWCMILLEAWDGHVGFNEAMSKILGTYDYWTIKPKDGGASEPPDALLIEDKAAGPLLIAELVQMGIANVYGVDPGDKSKEDRAERESRALFHGRVFATGRRMSNETRSDKILTSWAERVVDQCALFPAGTYNDHVDCCAQAWKHARTLGYLSLDTDHTQVDDPQPEDRRRESAYG